MVFKSIIAYAARRLAAHRRYRQVMAELRSMSNDDLHEIGAFQIDLYKAARRELKAG